MKRIFFALATLVFFAAFNFPKEALPIGADMPKPDVKMKDISGDLVSLHQAKDANGLLVMFSCNTCPYVIKNQSRTKSICIFTKSKNVGVIILNSNEGGRRSGESLADMQQYGKEAGYNWYYALDNDSELADAFGATRTPECFLFDKNNKLVYHGAIDDSPPDINEVKRAHLKEAINELTIGKDISVKESRSIGCAIRRKG